MKTVRKILIILVFMLTLILNVKADDVINGTSYTLPSSAVNALLKAKVYRGYGMDRQDLGMYMPAGSSFKIRAKQNVNLTIEVLNNDSETESKVTVSTDWVTITADTDSVPFIKTFHSDNYENVGYEIKDKTGVLDLTKFIKGGNETTYINTWKANNHQYSVITDDYTTFLVPRTDISVVEKVINNTSTAKYPFTSLNDMLNWYDGVLTRYNNYIGLSSNASENYNKDIRMKYFFKANRSGVGLAAYYPWNYVATNSESLASFFEKGWVSLHEMGHGFQSAYTWNPKENDIKLSETENNIFAYYEQLKFIDGDSDSFLWANKTQEDYMEGIANTPGWEGILEQDNFNDMVQTGSADHAGHRLFTFVNLFDKIGMENTMSYTLKKYRDIISNDEEISNSDLFGKYFSEASGYNVIPYLNVFKIFPSSDIENEVYSKKQPILYPITKVFNKITATSIANSLGLRGPYSVVENNDVRNYVSTNKITRNVKFKIKTSNKDKLSHKKISIKNSSDEIIRQEVLTNDEIIIKNLPVGMYYLEISDGTVSGNDYILIPQEGGKVDLAPTGSSGSMEEENVLTIDIEYKYDPNSTSDEQIVDVPNTGVVTSVLIMMGMIFISLGIGLLVYKKDVLK